MKRALKPPRWKRVWHASVRVKESKKLVAFISGVPMEMKTDDKSYKMVEINFLCVHKKLRSKRLAPLLIKEITRRVNQFDIWQAVYTAGVKIPKPFGTGVYYHRSLNPRKLIDVEFSKIPIRFSKFQNPMKITEKLYKLPAVCYIFLSTFIIF